MHTAELSVDFNRPWRLFQHHLYVEMWENIQYILGKENKNGYLLYQILKQNESNYNSIILKKMGIDRSIENILQFSVKNYRILSVLKIVYTLNFQCLVLIMLKSEYYIRDYTRLCV